MNQGSVKDKRDAPPVVVGVCLIWLPLSGGDRETTIVKKTKSVGGLTLSSRVSRMIFAVGHHCARYLPCGFLVAMQPLDRLAAPFV
jgi:hypothetical protein